LMEPMLPEFGQVAARLSYAAATIPIVSNVTGRLATDQDLASADYWVRHVRSPVRFADGMRCLESRNVTTVVELGPDAVLSALGEQCVDGDVAFVPLLRRDRAEDRELVAGLGRAHARGVT